MLKQISKRNIQYILLLTVLPLFLIQLHDSTWVGNPQLHTIMEVIAASLAFFIGILSLIRYYTKKNPTFLFLGAGFLGTGLLDAYHGTVTSTFFINLFPSAPESLTPWSWFASRFFLSIMLFISWHYTKHKPKSISEINIYTMIGLFTLLSFILFAFLPLPPAYIDFPIGRPEEFLPAFFFLVAGIGFYQLKSWQNNSFHHFLVMAIIVNLVGQTVFMSTSQHLFDYQFDISHLLKKASYIIILIGLLINTFKLFNQGEQYKINSQKTLAENLNKDNKIKHLQEEFLFIAAHEIKSPVTTIQWNLDILKDTINKPQNPKNNQKIINEIESANQNLLTLVNNLLNITNLEFQKLNLNLKPHSPHQLIQEAIKKNQHHQNNYQVNLINLTTDKTQHIIVDKHKFLDVLYNLIGNAIKYNKPNGEVIVSAESENNNLHIFIKDSGMGISKDEISKIFQKFYRSQNARDKKVKGTGLGLYISEKIIEKMNGKIWAESDGINQGTTIHLLLPLAATNE